MNEFEIAVVKAVPVIFNVKAPCVPRAILQPAKLAIPPTAFTGFVVHVSVPVPVLIDRVIAETNVVTTSPDESST